MTSEATEEGFICPYCLVAFPTSDKLQCHFIDFHSEKDVGDMVDTYEVVDFGNGDSELLEGPLGHQFKPQRNDRLVRCDVCREIIWQDAQVCQVCDVKIHLERCEDALEQGCRAETEPASCREDVQRSAGPQQAAKGILPLVRRQVAKGRDRYVNDEFDLDLTYITERIIAMSFPASGMESAYRNSLKDVAKMLQTKHQHNYMIFNLSERSYDITKFNNQVLDFGWPDHLAPSLERLGTVCKSMKSWLDSDPQHVAVVHCKGGKGRTGCVIAAFMHYSSICDSADAALDRFAMKRFYDSKFRGVTQPSQRKYVHYFADLLAGKVDLNAPPVLLNHVIIHGTVPNFDGKGGCRPFLKIYENMKLVHTSGLFVCPSGKERVKISIYGGLTLHGEVLLKCFNKKTHSGADFIFRCQFHTAVVGSLLRLVYKKEELDDAFKDKRFPNSTKVELLFESADHTSTGNGVEGIEEAADIRSSLLESQIIEQLRGEHEKISKRDSYASFEGGYDSGLSGDRVPDLIQFSPTPSPRRDRVESTDSYGMDPDMIERMAPPLTEELYTVVSKQPVPAKAKPRAAAIDRRKQSHPLVMLPSKPPPPTKLLIKVASPPPPPITQQTGSKHSKPPTTSKPKVPMKRPIPSAEAIYSPVDDDEQGGAEVTGTEHLVRTRRKQFVESYDEVNPDQHIIIRPLPPRLSAQDNDMWVQFKFQTMPTGSDSLLSRRSSSSSNLSSDYYSNLAEFTTSGGACATDSPGTHRRHSFSDGDARLVIKAPANRDSIIPVNVGSQDDDLEPEYGNIDADGAVYAEPSPRRIGPPKYVNTAIMNGQSDLDDVYENRDPEGLMHVYSNQGALLAQLREGNMPTPERSTPAPETAEASPTPQPLSSKLPASLLKFLPLLGKSKPREIHSAKISEEDRHQTMAMFQLSTGTTVGRDYEAFFKKSAWGDTPSLREADSTAETRMHNASKPPRSHVPPPRPKAPPAVAAKPRDLASPEVEAAQQHRIPWKLSPTTPPGPTALSPQEPSSKPFPPSSPQAKRKPLQPPTEKKPPSPAPIKPHPKLTAAKSSEGLKSKPVIPPHGHEDDSSEKRRNAPSRPPPFTSSQASSHAVPPLASVKQLMPYWYRPNISREDAIEFVIQLEAGSFLRQSEAGQFIVRDSQTVSGGYALTIKVPLRIARIRKGLSEDAPLTVDKCVTHFLIQPDPEGVKLQGWNEKAFKSLPEFIAQHTVERLCLPCRLMLPQSGGGAQPRRKPTTMKEALITGAACDLVYLGSVDVSAPGNEMVLANTIELMKGLDPPSINVVTFKASKDGITLTDSSSLGLYTKRQYPISSITYCGLDPNDTRWDFPAVQHLGKTISLTHKPCFGIFHKPPDGTGYSCLLFAEFSSHQPVSSVVKYIQRIMKK